MKYFLSGVNSEQSFRAEFSEWSEGDEGAYYEANEAVSPYPSAKQLHLPENMSAEAEQRQTKFYEAI